jgi:hypothetical protein
VVAILKTWPGLGNMEVRKLTKVNCHEWAHRLRQHGTKFRPPGAKKERAGISPSRFNNTVTTLRQILSIAVDRGILFLNPVTGIKRARELQKELTLPSRAHFPEFVNLIDKSGAGQGLCGFGSIPCLLWLSHWGGPKRQMAGHSLGQGGTRC